MNALPLAPRRAAGVGLGSARPAAHHPFVDITYTKAYFLSSSGTYLEGRLHSLFGVRHDIFKRKRITDLPLDSIGQFVFLGYPDQAPNAYQFDPDSDLANNSYSSGLAYYFTPSVNDYANYSTSFRWQSTRLFTGENPGPVLGKSWEVGLKGSLLDNKMFFTVAGSGLTARMRPLSGPTVRPSRDAPRQSAAAQPRRIQSPASRLAAVIAARFPSDPNRGLRQKTMNTATDR